MKKIIIYIFAFFSSAFAFVFTSGCSKDCTDIIVHDSIMNFDTVTNTFWTLGYNQGTSGNAMYYAPLTFIKNGIAYFPSNLYHSSQWFSVYDLPIPKEINLDVDTDSLKLVANVRNVNGDGTANEIDLGLIYNLTTASQAGASWQKGSNPAFCLLGITGQQINNVSEQLTDPASYAEYAVGTQGNQVSSYKNGSLLKTSSYTGTTGKLKAIRVAFRGYGEVDWVKLYKGNKLIMIENFSVDGVTTAIWSKP